MVDAQVMIEGVFASAVVVGDVSCLCCLGAQAGRDYIAITRGDW